MLPTLLRSELQGNYDDVLLDFHGLLPNDDSFVQF